MAGDQRRLAAIVSIDVAGYSRLMGRDESGTLAALKALQREVVDPQIRKFGGRIVKTMGDGLLLEFASAVNAVRCAVDIQRDMPERNADVPAPKRIEFRIGINVGDIIADGDDIFGDGVNIAARIEALAEPGGIAVSGRVYEDARGKLDVAFEDTGEQRLKNIDRPTRVYRVVLAKNDATAAANESAFEQTPSIAVLPFVNRSPDKDDEYFADGLADELINVLAKVRGLRVAARSSAFTFKNKSATVAEIGRALNVSTILEGSVRKARNRMRITVQLVKVADGYHMWSESYDRLLDDIFAVEDDIAQSVVKALRTTLLGERADAGVGRAASDAVAAAVKGRGTDADAYWLYLQARFLSARYTREDTTKAIAYVNNALARDLRFALAWVELGTLHSRQADHSWVEPKEGYARAREAVTRALSLEPDLAEAHSALGWIQLFYDRDWRAAEASNRRALELAPGNAAVLRRAAVEASAFGRLDDAIELCRRALVQDPLSSNVYHNLGVNLQARGQYDEADGAFRKALEIAPQRSVTYFHLAMNLLAQGRRDDALAAAQQEPEEWARLVSLAIIHHAMGNDADSNEALDKLTETYQNEAALQIAMVYAAREQRDQAFTWLERAYAQRDPGLSDIKTDPLLRPLHADPRWNEFLRRMGFPDYIQQE